MKEMDAILNRIREISQKKSADYAAAGNEFENFERSAELMGWFKDEQNKAFIWPIGTKLARLATLLNNRERRPNNESIDDSFLDLVTYCILWWANYQRSNSIGGQQVEVVGPLAYIIDNPKLEEPKQQQTPCWECGKHFHHTPNTSERIRGYYYCSDRCLGIAIERKEKDQKA